MSIAVHGARKVYRAHRHRRIEPVVALDGVEVTVADGELLVVVGPSGSGKTTLLRCVAGLEALDEGRVDVGGRDVTDLLPGDRDIAMVFQDYALYPHIDVAANIAFGLRARKVPGDQIDAKVAETARRLGLASVLERPPDELSGGERQRVALARAIVREPAAFLMDEPLSNLDAELRVQTRSDIRALQKDLGTTTLFVTHDQVEAMTIGDRVAVLRSGRIEQVAAPTVLYDRPATAFVATFIGSPPMNLLPAEVVAGGNRATQIGLRPEKVRLIDVDDGRLTGRVTAVEPIGADAIVHVEVASAHRMLVRTGRDAAPAVGSEVGVGFDDRELYRFAADGRVVP